MAKAIETQTESVQVGSWMVDYKREEFRIFPRGKNGKTVPVRRINFFITLKHIKHGDSIVFKRYLHQGNWFWRDSREKNWVYEDEVVSELARHLYRGNKEGAKNLITSMLLGLPVVGPAA